ncbi:hypothetical protein SELSPUOL_00052 [Selenomonas sputigena ATCC 35185]|uniref:Uncharacterized protein n=1 Tax=Selenomonas sputigena (strain ATCC 35185 / DSM 20758 / CCUG 44933 / VPI D19B-28) TaxID=546271 RepID=C9LRI6_SELS3|nr:hypothetical protein SELSPUOL_00052 [Selenomonas sputigena ATCC 35185]
MEKGRAGRRWISSSPGSFWMCARRRTVLFSLDNLWHSAYYDSRIR